MAIIKMVSAGTDVVITVDTDFVETYEYFVSTGWTDVDAPKPAAKSKAKAAPAADAVPSA